VGRRKKSGNYFIKREECIRTVVDKKNKEEKYWEKKR